MFRWEALQRPDLGDLDNWVLEQYREMYDVFFEERNLIPPGSYHEFAFEELEKDPVGELRKLYQALRLPDFRVVETNTQGYTASLRGYQKNQFPVLPPQLKARMGDVWRTSIEEWGYAR
jgi:hypothetical protein